MHFQSTVPFIINYTKICSLIWNGVFSRLSLKIIIQADILPLIYWGRILRTTYNSRSKLSRSAEAFPTLSRSTMSTKSAHCTVGALAAEFGPQAEGVSLDEAPPSKLVAHPYRTCLLAPLYASCPSLLQATPNCWAAQPSGDEKQPPPHCQCAAAEPLLFGPPPCTPHDPGPLPARLASFRPRPPSAASPTGPRRPPSRLALEPLGHAAATSAADFPRSPPASYHEESVKKKNWTWFVREPTRGQTPTGASSATRKPRGGRARSTHESPQSDPPWSPSSAAFPRRERFTSTQQF